MMNPKFSAAIFLALAALPFAGASEPGPDLIPREEVPDKLITVANDPHFTLKMHEPVVVLTGDGRQPYLFVSKDGTLFCQAQMNSKPFRTKKDKSVYHYYIGSAISRDAGATWTHWTHEEKHDDVNIESGVAQDADGTIYLMDTFIMGGAKADHGVGELWKSHDDLRTVEGPYTVDLYLPTIDFTGSTDDMGRPHKAARLHRSTLVMPNGDLLTLMYSHFNGDTAPASYMPTMKKTRVVILRSHDHGQTWAYLATVAADGGVGTEGFGEPVCARITQGAHAGRLLCLMRTGREIFGAHSDDSGETWSTPEAVSFPGIDIHQTRKWASLFFDTKAPGYVPVDELIGVMTDPDLIEMKDGTLVCAVGGRIPARFSFKNWHVPENGDYLAFSRDGGETWSHVVQFRSAAPTTHYIGVREVKPGLLYVVHDDSVWSMQGHTLGFQLEVTRK